MRNLKRLVSSGLASLGLCAAAAHGQIVMMDFNNEAGCANGTLLLDSNVTGLSVCRGLGLTWTSVSNGYNSNSWTAADEAGAVASDDYVSVVFTVNSGFNANIDSIVGNLQRSSTGPQNAFIRSSLDGFATTLATVSDVPTSAGVRIFDIPDIIGATGTIEFRVYGWGASSNAGTLRFQDNATSQGLIINGVIQTGGGGDPQGACCYPSGNCAFVTQATCQSGGGVYQGDGVTCDSANCPVPTGACCVEGFCGVGFTEALCVSSGGTWLGVDSTCDGVNCPQPTGRCCLPDNTCIEMVTQADCDSMGGSNWLLDGFCDSFTCVPNVGACCLPDLSCIVTDGPGCVGMGGAWMGRGIACENVDCAPASGPNLVAKYDFDVNRVGVGRNLSFTFSPMPPFSSAGDGFGPLQRFFTASEPPFTLLDDTISIFEPDQIGIVDENKRDTWFGINDLLNNDNLSGIGTAEWTFDISGWSNLSISIDLAAMGDFEATGANPDQYDFAVSIDGGAPVVVFSLRCDEAIDQTYTLASGTMVTLPDPQVLNGTTVLNNILQTFSANISGTGSVLTLTLTASNDSDEGVVFDNIMIMGDMGGPMTGGCCLTDGTCVVQTSAECASAGGAYQGDGSVCNQTACDALNVACCLNSTCQVLPLGGCLFQGGTAEAFAADCAGVACASNCPADWDGNTLVEVLDIFAFLTDWFAGEFDAQNFGGTVGVPAIFAFLTEWFAAGVGPCN